MYSEYDMPSYDMCNITDEKTLRDYVKDPKIVLAVILPIITLISMFIFYTSNNEKTITVEYVADIEHVRFYKVHYKNNTYLLATNQYSFQILNAN